MTYFYKITIRYVKGKQDIIKSYTCDFLHVGILFGHLEAYHHDNYTLLDIKRVK